MLLELRIENLLLIERAELRLGRGLNAITGETGAGKTILAHSLDLILGGKARPQIVRPDASEAYVEGVFELPEGLLRDPELAEIAERLPEGATEIALGRRVGDTGRTSAFIQGRVASAARADYAAAAVAYFEEHLTATGADGTTWAESWDAVGLVCGDPEQPVSKVLFAVDPAPAVVEEAAA